MNKLQFWILNAACVLLSALLLAHFFFSRSNNRLADTLGQERAYINSSRQLESVLDALAKRIAVASDADPKLRNILVKHGMNVTLEVDGKKRTYP
jgi:hypothetical protein